MTFLKPAAVALIAAISVVGVPEVGSAQAPATDPHHPPTGAPGATPSPGAPAPGAQTRQPGAMGSGMMGHMMGMMDGMRSGMAGRGPVGGHAQMMKVMFAIADTDADGALSFDEISAIHRRIFTAVDADKNGKVTPEEMRAFMGN